MSPHYTTGPRGCVVVRAATAATGSYGAEAGDAVPPARARPRPASLTSPCLTKRRLADDRRGKEAARLAPERGNRSQSAVGAPASPPPPPPMIAIRARRVCRNIRELHTVRGQAAAVLMRVGGVHADIRDRVLARKDRLRPPGSGRRCVGRPNGPRAAGLWYSCGTITGSTTAPTENIARPKLTAITNT